MEKFKIGDKVRWNQYNDNVVYTVTKIREVEGVTYISLSWFSPYKVGVVDYDNEWYSAENFDLITEQDP